MDFISLLLYAVITNILSLLIGSLIFYFTLKVFRKKIKESIENYVKDLVDNIIKKYKE